VSPIPARVTAVDTYDIRFPTSRELDGSDAMNPDPDYSAAYVVLRTDAADGHEGHGFSFTIGRGNEVQVAAIHALRDHVIGRSVDELCADPGVLNRDLIGDSQLRWLGPEKGVMHMAIGAVINAAWDLTAKRAGKPLWQLLADADPEWLVSQIDFRYITDALTPAEALDILRRGRAGAENRRTRLLERGFPAYTTSAGWLGYDDEKLTRLAVRAVQEGFRQIKLKVGADLDDDIRRCRVARSAVGPDIRMAIDANQRWNVDEAIRWTKALAEFDPYWIEEPTSPDDVLGHAAIRAAVAR
jgi:L-fuconate dehydratase